MKNRVIAGLAILFVSFFGVSQAQAGDEPQPGVARVSVIHGDVSMQRGDSGDWVAASINAPVVAGDQLSTGLRSRTEVQLDYANVLRLSSRTEAKLADLTRTHAQVQLRRGLMNYDVLKGSEADVEIDTPNVAMRPVLGEGSYRVEVFSDEETRIIVRKGEADITTPQGSTTVKKGDLITIRGHENPEYQVSSAPKNDDWDEWNKDRDHQIADARSWEHTNRYYTGAYELDNYGRWVYAPGYGMVWSPYGGPDWAPYRYGRWVWEPYWGWTWASYEPWGWAPYHYGRWFLYSGSWCWWPGPVFGGYRPLWAPAFVTFFGFGRHAGFGVGFGFGSIGWLPVGPGDYYYPWWGGRRREINVVNITNITNIRNVDRIAPLGTGRARFSNVDEVFRNPRLQRGLTTMPGNDFGRTSVPREHRGVTLAELRQGQMVAGNVPVVPTRESLRTTSRAVNPATVPAQGDRPQRFFTRSQPTYTPQPFHTEAAQVREAVQQQAEIRQREMNRPGAPETRNPGTPAPARTDTAARPMRGGEDTRTAASPEVQKPAAETAREASAPGWRRFGDRNTEQAQNRRAEPQTPARERTQAAPRTQTPARTQAPAQPQNAPRSQAPVRENAPREAESGGWRKFTGPAAPPRPTAPQSDRGPAGARPNTTTPPPREAQPQRGTGPGAAEWPPEARSADRPGWQRFEPQPERSEPRRMESPATERPSPMERGSAVDRGGRGGWEPPAARSSAPRGERPPLEMRRPIVVPRASAPSGRQSAPSRQSSPPRQSAPSRGSRGPGRR
jgi:hypothetical protein